MQNQLLTPALITELVTQALEFKKNRKSLITNKDKKPCLKNLQS